MLQIFKFIYYLTYKFKTSMVSVIARKKQINISTNHNKRRCKVHKINVKNTSLVLGGTNSEKKSSSQKKNVENGAKL